MNENENENGVLPESALPKDDAHNDAFQGDTHVHAETTMPQSPKKRATRNRSKPTTTTQESNEGAVMREKRSRRKSVMPVSSVVEVEATVAQKTNKRKRVSLPVSKKEREHIETPAKKPKNDTKTPSQLNRIEFGTNLEIIDEEHEPSTSQDADDEGGEEENEYTDDEEEQAASESTYSVGDLVEAKDLKKNADIWYPAKVIEVQSDTKKVKIHFVGWNARYDSFYPIQFDVLRPVKKEEANKVLSSVKKGRKPKVSLAKKSIEPNHVTIKIKDNSNLNAENHVNDQELRTTQKNKSKVKQSKPEENGTTILTILQQKGVDQEAKENVKSASDEINHSKNDHESAVDDDSDAEYSFLTQPIQN
jgi:hypothetical protein